MSRRASAFLALHLRVAAPVLVATLLVTGALRAQPADPTLDEARRHFDEGVRLYDKRDFEGALAEFRAAHAAHPSPAILRNVALSLRALGRNAEAIDALEQMLLEGRELTPSVRDAAARTLEELRAKAATVRVHVVFNAPPGTVSPEPVVALDGRPITAAKMLQPVWVDPGPHTITASAPGFTDAAVTVVANPGDREVPADVSLVARAALVGTVTVRVNVASATISVDGENVGRGMWQGPLAPGKHRIEASAAGMRTVQRDVEVAERGVDEVLLELSAEPSAPGGPTPDVARRWFMGVHVGMFGGELPVKPVNGGPQGFVAATLAARFGRRFGPYLALEIDGELQGGGTREFAFPADSRTSYTMTHAAIGGGARLSSGTQPHFMLGGVGGFVNQSITRTVNGVRDAQGGAPTGFLQVEGGIGIELSRAINLEIVALIGLLGVNADALSGTVMGRYGGRAGLAFKF